MKGVGDHDCFPAPSGVAPHCQQVTAVLLLTLCPSCPSTLTCDPSSSTIQIQHQVTSMLSLTPLTHGQALWAAALGRVLLENVFSLLFDGNENPFLFLEYFEWGCGYEIVPNFPCRMQCTDLESLVLFTVQLVSLASTVGHRSAWPTVLWQG